VPAPRTPIRRTRTIAIASSLALVVGACGGSADDSVETVAAAEATASPTTADAPAPRDTEPAAEPTGATDGAAATEPESGTEPDEPAGPNDLPAVVVRDIATGDEIDLSAFAPGELPFVVWFYAPH